jgi:multiple antibiotic resistance protein
MAYSFFFTNSLYFLALINPASKIFLLSSIDPPYSWPDLRRVSLRCTYIALAILVVMACAGSFLLESVFQVQVYSLKVAGGIILFLIGLAAVRKGVFHENPKHEQQTDIAIVPLAAPLIAGPGTIAGAISFHAIYGGLATVACLTGALALNLVLMLCSRQIAWGLNKTHAMGPLVRITGLIVAAISVQMLFSGCEMWFKTLH